MVAVNWRSWGKAVAGLGDWVRVTPLGRFVIGRALPQDVRRATLALLAILVVSGALAAFLVDRSESPASDITCDDQTRLIRKRLSANTPQTSLILSFTRDSAEDASAETPEGRDSQGLVTRFLQGWTEARTPVPYKVSISASSPANYLYTPEEVRELQQVKQDGTSAFFERRPMYLIVTKSTRAATGTLTALWEQSFSGEFGSKDRVNATAELALEPQSSLGSLPTSVT